MTSANDLALLVVPSDEQTKRIILQSAISTVTIDCRCGYGWRTCRHKGERISDDITCVYLNWTRPGRSERPY